MTFGSGDSFSSHVRANHASEAQPTIPGQAQARPTAGRLPRPRTLAAGGAVLAQVWGIGLGMTSAYAAANEPLADTVRAVDSAGVTATGAAGLAPPGGITPPADPGGRADVAAHPAANAPGAASGSVDQLLQSKIRAGGLPLPGQATAIPDAFAIAAVLLPAVPEQPQPRTEWGTSGGGSPEDRAAVGAGETWGSGEATAPGDGSRAGGPTSAVPAARTGGADGTGDPRAETSATALAARVGELAASRDGGRGTVGTSRSDSAGGSARDTATRPGGDWAAAGRGSSADPLAATGTEGAVLIPIAAGLLLTGAAMYKHRGLPGGH